MSQELFCYARLSRPDLCLFRIGGPGLGNLLFVWARAVQFSLSHGAVPLWPTWRQLKVGPWLRGEKDKRGYGDLFRPPPGYITGVSKMRLLLTVPACCEDSFNTAGAKKTIVVFSGGRNGFADLDSACCDSLLQQFESMVPGAHASRSSTAVIRIHVRLGDFAVASPTQLELLPPNVRLPVEWYVEKLRQVRATLGYDAEAEVFSDDDARLLSPLTQMPNVRMAPRRTAAEDLLCLARARILIGSNSTFSHWARFFGRQFAVWYGSRADRWPHFRPEDVDCVAPLNSELSSKWKHLVRQGLQ